MPSAGSSGPHRSSAVPLAWLYAALIVYASLYPFTPWRVPGVAPWAFLALPWPRYWTWFDLVVNLTGYVPFGGLVYAAIVRSGGRARLAMALAPAAALGLSLAMEVTQNFLPQRVASNVDLAVNGLGGITGAALAAVVQAHGRAARWQAARDRWFIARSRGALALLLLWPVGLLFPLPVPLGQGQVLDKLRHGIAALVDGSTVEPWFDGWAEPLPVPPGLSPAGEFAAVALGLLGPCLVAFAVAHRGWRRWLLALGLTVCGAAMTTLSVALNFGPQHLAAWGTPRVLAAFATALLVAWAAVRLPRRAAAALALVALAAAVVLVAQAPSDPFFAASLDSWGRGRFVRFYGAARFVGWGWPYAAMAYLLVRLGSRDREPDRRTGAGTGNAGRPEHRSDPASIPPHH